MRCVAGVGVRGNAPRALGVSVWKCAVPQLLHRVYISAELLYRGRAARTPENRAALTDLTECVCVSGGRELSCALNLFPPTAAPCYLRAT